jgi:hypothetical protein
MLNQSPAPAVYIPFNAQYGIKDQSGNGRDATAQNQNTANDIAGAGAALRPNIEPADKGVDVVTLSNEWYSTSYSPFTAAFTAAGVANRNGTANTHALFGSAGPNRCYLTLVSGSNDVNFVSDGSTITTFTNRWPGTSQSVAWSLAFDPGTDVVDLTIRQGSTQNKYTGSNTGNLGSAGALEIGSLNSGSSPFNGTYGHFTFFTSYISDTTNILQVLHSGMPGRVIEST